MKYILRIIFVILGVLARPSNAESFDDFLNNLYSDLAPLITLFGERVTMQFISQALGFADCIALAMFPLGIITIMVSAIRVGGPTWLKAIVGRAKENKAAAELELMSSTSREVCELFNGENIVRCLGSGSVWQYVCLFRKGTGSGETERGNVEIEFMTPDEAVKGGFLGLRYESVSQMIWRKLRRNVLLANLVSPSKEPCIELGIRDATLPRPPKVIVIHDDKPEAPNISLNLQGHPWRLPIRFVAMIGFYLQVGILMFFWRIVDEPKYRLIFTKDDKPVRNHAFPLTFTGTIALVIGMIICAHVVERGTREKTYHVDNEFEMRLYWLQNQQTVNDQMFESFSIAQSKTCHNFRTSRREGKYRQKRWLENWQQIRATAGVIIGVTGFVLQFVGLRSMSPYASLAQLCCIALMTFLRAVIFPGFSTSFKPAKLADNFELDWLAQKLGIEARLISHEGAAQGKEGGDDGLKHRILISWSILHDRKDGYRALEPLTPAMSQASASEAQHVLVMRRGLRRLSKVSSTASKCAAKLATAMENALGILFPNGSGPEGAQGFRWVIDVSMEGVTQQVWIDFPFANGVWKVPACDLEAALSLSTYTNEAAKEKQKSGQQRKEAENIEDENDGRGRHESSPKDPEPTLDEVNRTKDYVIRDLGLWILEDTRALAALKKKMQGLRAFCARDPGHQGSITQMLGSDLLDVDIYATRLLFSFIWSMAKALRGRIKGKAKSRRDTCNGCPHPEKYCPLRILSLQNAELNALARTLAMASCLPEQATMIETVTALSVTGKLPIPQPWFDSQSAVAQARYESGNLHLLEIHIIHAISRVRDDGDQLSGVAHRAVAWLLELYHSLTRTLKRFGHECEPRSSRLQDLRHYLHLELTKTVDDCFGPDFLGHMSNLYARQGREMDLDFRRAARGELPAYLEVTSLHRRAMSRSIISSVPLEQQALLDAQDISNWSPLHWAAARANVELAKRLLELGADKTLRDLGGFTAAHYACQSGCPKMIRLFIEKKVALDTQATDGTFPMHLAVETGNHNVVKILLENKNGTDADQRPRDFDGRMPVHYAAAGGHALIVRMLKADIDAQDDSGWTALHMAALAEKKFLIKMLYELSADGEVKDKMGRTPLVLACSEGRWGAVGELVNAGATVDEKDSDGMTVFHHLAIKGASSALISTIVEGLDGTDIRRLINSQDPGGRTPLYIAAGTRNRDTVHGLIQAGADVTMIGGGRLDFMASKG